MRSRTVYRQFSYNVLMAKTHACLLGAFPVPKGQGVRYITADDYTDPVSVPVAFAGRASLVPSVSQGNVRALFLRTTASPAGDVQELSSASAT